VGKSKNSRPEIFEKNTDYQYTIKKDDKISISVWDHEDLSVGSVYGIYNSNEVYGKWLLVDARGEIAIPKTGNIKVEGYTIIQAEDSIAKILAKQIVNPVVKIKVMNREVTVLGEVKSPGNVLIEKEEVRVVDVIGKSGDFDFYADKKNIKIVRKINNQTYDYKVNLTRLDTYSQTNVRILPGDIIYVPSKRGKSFDKKITTLIPVTSAITTIIIIIKTFF
jgi:polysaccharide export outer membrane protein